MHGYFTGACEMSVGAYCRKLAALEGWQVGEVDRGREEAVFRGRQETEGVTRVRDEPLSFDDVRVRELHGMIFIYY